MKRLLFLSYGGGHAKILRRVAGEVPRRFPGEFSSICIGLTTAGPEYRRAGLPALGFADYADAARDEEALVLGEQLAGENHNSASGISYRESVAYLGLSMWDLIQRLGEKEAWGLYKKVRRMAFCPVSILERILEREKPDVVITTNSPKSERAALIAAKGHGIATLRVEDLFGFPMMPLYLKRTLGQDAAKIVLPVHPSRVAVMSEVARENVLLRQADEEMYIAPENVRITGQPVIDDAATHGRTLVQRECRRQAGLPLQRPVLLWPTDQLPLDRTIFAALRAVFEKQTDWFLIIKLHPGSSPEWNDFYARNALPNMRVMADGDIHSLIAAVDAVLTHFTTVGIETIAIGRPLVLVDFSSQAERFAEDPLLEINYEATVVQVRQGATAVVRDLGLLEEALQGVFEGRIRRDVDPGFLNADGNSASRIAKLIRELAS